MNLYLALFLVFFKIGLFGFGGGYAIVSMIEHETVEVHQWLTTNQFTDITAISQATPGPLAINCATFVGYTTTQSVWGAALATFAVSLPAILLMGIVVYFLQRFQDNKWMRAAMSGLKPASLGLFAAAALVLATPANFIDLWSYLLCAIAFVASLCKINPVYLLVLGGLAGYLIY